MFIFCNQSGEFKKKLKESGCFAVLVKDVQTLISQTWERTCLI